MSKYSHLSFALACACAGFFFATSAVAAPVSGRYVRCRIPKTGAILSLAEVEVMSQGKNVAPLGRACQINVANNGEANRAIDGNTSERWGSGSITHTIEAKNTPPPWWELDLGRACKIDTISLYNRGEADRLTRRLDGVEVLVMDSSRKVVWSKRLGKAAIKNTFAVDFTEPGPFAGERIPDGGKAWLAAPMNAARMLELYQKKGDWVDTLLALGAKVEDRNLLRLILPKVCADFPSHAHEVVLGYEPELFTPEICKGGRAAYERARAKRPYGRGSADTIRLRWFNADALARAISAYAEKYPTTYNKSALLKELDAVKKLVAAAQKGTSAQKDAAARAIEKLTDAIYLRHPAVNFQKMLVVRRNRISPSGLPHNWQGNSSTALHGYLTDIVEVPLKQTRDTAVRAIVSSDSFLGDVDLDFDGEKIAYSAGVTTASTLRRERGWRVMETALAQPGVRKQLSPPDIPDIDCYDPCYLPDGRMLFVATSGFHGVPCVGGSDYVGNTHLLEKDGTVRRLVFDQDNSWCPVVMNNGRVLYLRWEYTDSAHYFSRVMMTMNPDGSDQKAFYGSNSYWPNSLFFARPLPGSVTKFCGIVTGHHGLAREGELVLFDVLKGRNETGGVVQRIPGWGKPVPNKTRDQLVNGSRPLFLHPYPVSDELFLVAMHEQPGAPFFIAFVDVYDNIVPLWRYDNMNLLEPLPVAPRKRPIVSINRRDDTKNTCTVYLQAVGHGGGLKGVPRGVAKKLRVFHYSYSPRNQGGHYTIGFEGPWDARNIIGEVDLEADGSCMFTAPANTPIAVQPLDAEGHKMQEMRSWFVGVPGETLACTGCHENQNEAPPATRAIAFGKKPQTIQPWKGPRRSYAFEREVQPVLDAKCVGCHNSKATGVNKLGQKMPNFEGLRNGPASYGYSTSYIALMPYVRRNGPEGDYHLLTPLEFHVDTSELRQMLVKGHHGVKLTDDEWNRLSTWMDLNVPFWGTWGEIRPGHARDAQNLARRKEMAAKWAGDTYDPEAIVNPYKPGTAKFTPPARCAKPAPAPQVAGWPFDAARAKALQGAQASETIDLGNGQKLVFSRIPAGTFPMGANDQSPAERPVHAVTIGQAFWMCQTEITQAQMRLMDPSFDNGVYDMHYKDQVKRGYYMGDEDSDFAQPGHENFPAIRVSWQQANAFCAWLSKKTGRKVRLPSEAQWEWACRAGTATALNYGDWNADFSKQANLADYMFIELAVRGVNPQPFARGNERNPRRRPPALWDYELRDNRYNDGVLHLAQVGSYQPNAWGLKDMHGNVAEWTRTAWAPYAAGAVTDRDAANDDPNGLKVVRGGSWARRQLSAASAARWRYPAWMRPFDVGFRVVIED